MFLRVTLAFLTLSGWLAAAGVRVVSQTVGSDELLLALAAPGEIAALSHLSNDPSFSAVAEQAKAFPRLAANADAEAILAHRPTLVLFADYSRADLRAQVDGAGLKTLVFSRYATLADSFANLRELAAHLGPGAPERAEALIAATEARVERLRRILAGARPVRVIAPSTYGIIPGRETTFQDLCDHAGAENLAATLGGLVGHAPQPSESMLTWPIEFLVVGAQELDLQWKKLEETPPYRFMPAVRERRFVQVESWQLSCVSHLRVDGYEKMARQLHPERFP